ncbi:MFS transporter [Streptomyces mirabilis]|uniref:MFS transporter n=1 Tax=Streptomyces mirabilis TaxID=68239 RepID=UPI0036BEDCF9
MGPRRVGRKKVIITCTAVFSLASALCAVAPSLGVFGLGRFIAGLGLGGLLPTTITMVAEYAPRGRRALIVGTLMTAHQAGGILAGFVGLWTTGAGQRRVAYWICVVPLLIGVPLIATYLPESLNFLVAKGRTREARALAERYDVELPGPAAERPAAGDRWSAVVALFRGGLWRTTLLFWLASFCGLLLVYGVSNWLPTMMRGAGYELGSSLSFVIVINLGGIPGMLIAGRFSDHFGGARGATVWFAATALGVHLLGIHMTLPLTYVVVFLTGLFLFSAQAMIYATVAGRSGDDKPCHRRGLGLRRRPLRRRVRTVARRSARRGQVREPGLHGVRHRRGARHGLRRPHRPARPSADPAARRRPAADHHRLTATACLRPGPGTRRGTVHRKAVNSEARTRAVRPRHRHRRGAHRAVAHRRRTAGGRGGA